MATRECDILLVEDNPTDAEMMVRVLRRAKVTNDITVVEDGAEALDYLLGIGAHTNRSNHGTPRVVLLDLKLPKLSGLEVLRRMRSEEGLRHVPVVVVTSSSEEPDIAEAYRLGVNSYVVKPVEFERFAEAMTHVGLYWMLVNVPPV